MNNKDILELLSSINNAEVFTPPAIVNQMLDLLPKELWSNPHTTVLDPCVKSGVFLREAFFRFDKGLKKIEKNILVIKKENRVYDFSIDKDRIDYIFKYMLFGISTSYLTSLISRRTLYGVMFANENKKDYINSNDIVEINTYYNSSIFNCKEGNIFYDDMKNLEGKDEDSFYPFIEEDIHSEVIKQIKEGKMKFDVIIGNPPYQISSESGEGSAKPIYNLFIEKSIDLKPNYLTMIVPSRWMTGGKGLDNFRKKMLEDKNLSKIFDFKNEKECFPSVEIKGGVCYFLWIKNNKENFCEYNQIENNKIISTKKRNLNEFDIFIRDNFSTIILNKIIINNLNNDYINKIIIPNAFNLGTNFKDYSEIEIENGCKLYGNKQNMKKTKGIGYVNKKNITKNKELIDFHKVLLPTANGTGKDNLILPSPPFYAEPNSICSATYLTFILKNKEECENLIKYIKTKFFRFLISLRKNTQHNNQKVFSFVPLLDMRKEWTDKELYEKYKLTKEEIDYIENSIKEMN